MMASYWYQFAHLSVTLAVLVWCWHRRVASYRQVRNALVLINSTGLVVFLLYPAAPPRLLPGAGFVDVTARAGASITPDQFGAFPSLHLGWAVWTRRIRAHTGLSAGLVHGAYRRLQDPSKDGDYPYPSQPQAQAASSTADGRTLNCIDPHLPRLSCWRREGAAVSEGAVLLRPVV